MRPNAIKIFELLFGAGIVASAVDITLPDAPTSWFDILPLAISLALAAWVSRGRSNVARWVLTVLIALGVAGQLYLLATGGSAGSPWGFVATALQAAAVAMLFTRPAQAWFARQDATTA